VASCPPACFLSPPPRHIKIDAWMIWTQCRDLQGQIALGEGREGRGGGIRRLHLLLTWTWQSIWEAILSGRFARLSICSLKPWSMRSTFAIWLLAALSACSNKAYAVSKFRHEEYGNLSRHQQCSVPFFFYVSGLLAVSLRCHRIAGGREEGGGEDGCEKNVPKLSGAVHKRVAFGGLKDTFFAGATSLGG